MWDNTNKLMYPPLNENDISQAVGGAAGHDSGSIDDLCYYGNINVWAKYKPVRSSEPGMVDRNTLEMLGFGSLADLPRATTIAGLINKYDGGFNGWTYLRTGDAASRRGRYYDFLKVANGNLDTVNPGYHGTAPNPFGSSFSASPATVEHNAGVLRVEQRRFPPVGDYPDYDLAIKDFNDLLNSSQRMLYYGCVIKGAPGGQASSIGARLFGNDSITIGTTRGKEELYYDLTLNATTFATVGDYLVYPCLSNGPLGFNVSLVSGQYLYPIPGVSPATITIVDDYIVIVCTARAFNNVGTGYYVQWSYTVYNYYSSAITLTNGKAKFRLSGKGFNDPMISGEVEVTLGSNGSITVPANGSYEYPGSGLTTDQQLTDRNLSQLIVGFMYNNQLKTGYRDFIVPAAPTL